MTGVPVCTWPGLRTCPVPLPHLSQDSLIQQFIGFRNGRADVLRTWAGGMERSEMGRNLVGRGKGPERLSARTSLKDRTPEPHIQTPHRASRNLASIQQWPPMGIEPWPVPPHRQTPSFPFLQVPASAAHQEPVDEGSQSPNSPWGHPSPPHRPPTPGHPLLSSWSWVSQQSHGALGGRRLQLAGPSNPRADKRRQAWQAANPR